MRYARLEISENEPEPMTLGEYIAEHGDRPLNGRSLDEKGYYLKIAGYQFSWVPKDRFEKLYFPCDLDNFEPAIEAIKRTLTERNHDAVQ